MYKNKNKMLCLLEILRNTDEGHPLNAKQLVGRLKMYGIDASPRSIGGDIAMLRSIGYDIAVCRDPRKGYYLCSHFFEDYESKMLSDMLGAAPFITEKDSYRLIEKIKKLSSPSIRSVIDATLCLDKCGKTKNVQTKLALDCMIRAIQRQSKVEFYYRRAGEEEAGAPESAARMQCVSPYYLVFHIQDYYLIGATDKHDALTVFRADRIKQARETEERIRPREEIPELNGHFDVNSFLHRTLSLYRGETVRVRLKCEKQVLGAVTRQFGRDIPIRPADGNFAFVQICCDESVALYRWLMGHCDQISVEEPESVRKRLKECLQKAAAYYE